MERRGRGRGREGNATAGARGDGGQGGPGGRGYLAAAARGGGGRVDQRGGRGGGRGRGGTDNPARRFFDMCLKKAEFHLDAHSAQRFAEAARGYTEELPWRLARSSERGLQRLDEAVQAGGADVAVTLIRALMSPSNLDPRYKVAHGLCLQQLAASPGFFDMLAEALERRRIRGDALDALSSFGVALSLIFTTQRGDHAAAFRLERLHRLAEGLVAAAGEHPPVGWPPALGVAMRLRALTNGRLDMAAAAEAAAVAGPDERLPGGRHDNDHPDFRSISVVPTAEELSCHEAPFLPRANTVEPFLAHDPESQHLDRHFRLLREDFLATNREAQQQAKPGAGGFVVKVSGMDLRHEACTRRNCWRCYPEDGEVDDTDPHMVAVAGPIALKLGIISKQTTQTKKAFVQQVGERRQLQEHSLVMLQDGEKILAVGRVISRELIVDEGMDNDLMAHVSVAFHDPTVVLTAASEERKQFRLVGFTGAFFAFEPVLSCLQGIDSLPFRDLLTAAAGTPVESPPPEYERADQVLPTLRRNLERNTDLQHDEAQQAAFEALCTQRVGLVVGPPGTGKSFLGSQIAQAILGATNETILVLCYTNHALDQFLLSLLKELPEIKSKMVRLGSRTKDANISQLTLFERSRRRDDKATHGERFREYDIRTQQESLRRTMKVCHEVLMTTNHLSWRQLTELLEMEDPDALLQLYAPRRSGFMDAPEHKWEHAASGGKVLRDADVYKRWLEGKPRLFGMRSAPDDAEDLWALTKEQRLAKAARWLASWKSDAQSEFMVAHDEYNQLDIEMTAMRQRSHLAVLREARVIGATTTGAAMKNSLLKSLEVGVILVEEAGEVLEAHVLAALTPATKQLIMIGDHLQLRPKVESYNLTVSGGKGFDLNKSMFERLIMGGHPHKQLSLQHRMRPEISAIARHMTYPELRDDPAMSLLERRPHVRGLGSDVVFISHTVREDGAAKADAVTGFASVSKCNSYEADLVVQIVNYLLLQGYDPDQLVVLTPYLGQLRVLRDKLSQSEKLKADISEADQEDLVYKLKVAAVPVDELSNKSAIRIATVDNYQGEEADLVVASLVRSNPKNQIGFLGVADAEQRINVLCTRARMGFIVVGNFACLENRSPVWQRLMGHMRASGSVFQGLPTKCQRHGEVCQATELRTPEQLAQRIAKGAGCSLPCLGLLPCQHPCPLSCHPFEHDKVKCARIVRVDCAAGSHRVEKACCEAQAPPCREPVVEHCEELGHPLVRQCCASPVCGICRVLEAADRKRDAAEAVFTKKVEALLIALAAHAAHPPQGGDASSSSATAAVSPSLKNESIMSKMKGLSIGTASAISKSSTPASTNPEEDVARNGELSELMEEHAAAKTKLERALRADLDRATARAGNEVADAIRRLQLNHEQNQERMQARHADTEAHLQRVAAQLEAQRVAAQNQAEADKREEDNQLKKLHDALVAAVASDAAAVAEAAAVRPAPETVAQRLQEVKQMARPAKCVICLDDELTVLDGIFCRAVPTGTDDDHFMCDPCFAHHVAAECEKPEFDGDVHCPHHSNALGCTSSAYHDALLAQHVTPAVFQQLQNQRLKLRENAANSRMQAEFDARLEKLRKENERVLQDLSNAKAEQLQANLEQNRRRRQVQEAKRHIIDRILTMRCPRCEQAFLDFDGCWALTCARQGCGCAFCANCLKDCGNDAHAHVARCNGDVFGSIHNFSQRQKQRQRKLVEEYLANPALIDVRVSIKQACERELADLYDDL